MLQSISWDQLKAKPVLRLHLCLTSSLVLSCMLREPFPSSENTLYHIPCIRTPISSSASRVTPNSHYSRYLKNFLINYILIQFSSVTQSCPTLCDPRDRSTAGLPVHHQLQESPQTYDHWVMPFNHLILFHPLLLPPSIFPSIRVFSNESVLCIRWPKYCSFSFNISPSNEYSGVIFFRMDWLEI